MRTIKLTLVALCALFAVTAHAARCGAPKTPRPVPEVVVTPIADATPAAPPPPAVEIVNLSADALFAFGKSDSIPPKGRALLEKWIAETEPQFSKIAKFEVIGHADKIGPAAISTKLSEERAKTIHSMLLEMGVPAQKIQHSGVGSSQPIFHGCSAASTKENIECNAPNRRVEIKVTGERRVN